MSIRSEKVEIVAALTCPEDYIQNLKREESLLYKPDPRKAAKNG